MNTSQLIEYLRKEVKIYLQLNPEMPQSTFSNTLTRYEAGLVKPKTLANFFGRFGYYEGENGLWLKK